MSARELVENRPSEGGRGGKAGGGKEGGEQKPQKTPFLQISVIKEVNQSTNTAHYDYVAFR